MVGIAKAPDTSTGYGNCGMASEISIGTVILDDHYVETSVVGEYEWRIYRVSVPVPPSWIVNKLRKGLLVFIRLVLTQHDDAERIRTRKSSLRAREITSVEVVQTSLFITLLGSELLAR
jgi:hypothetical protein